MARFNPSRDIEPVLRAAERWKDRCLAEDGSVLADNHSLWSTALIDELDRYFVQNPDESDASFFDKLKNQLRDASR